MWDRTWATKDDWAREMSQGERVCAAAARMPALRLAARPSLSQAKALTPPAAATAPSLLVGSLIQLDLPPRLSSALGTAGSG